MLEKLRAKPDHIKEIISIVLSTLIFSVIAFVWLSSWDARNSGVETREKTLSPLGSLNVFFHGTVSDFRKNISDAPSYLDNNTSELGTSIPSATSSSGFDMSGVVVIDSMSTTTTATTTTTTATTATATTTGTSTLIKK